VTRTRDRVTHLVTRFGGSLRPRAVSHDDVRWVHSVLTPGEADVWEELGRADRAESVAVGRRAQLELGVDGGPFVAAALLHDIGKTGARLGTVGRSFATIVAAVAGHDRARGWARGATGWRRRVGRYLAHDDAGAAELRQAGARPEVVQWARIHHRPQRWTDGTIPPETCIALARADGERT
jgi:putative nucleotidyltransferase with HDIG domain